MSRPLFLGTPRYVIVWLAVSILLTASSCDSETGPEPEPTTFDRPAMLANWGNNVILPAYEQLLTSVNALKTAADQFADAPSEANLLAARNALKSARSAWQHAAPFQFGPAESLTLRSVLNTYPTNQSQVEDNITSGSYTLGSVAQIAAGGFPAIGYLLYGDDLTDQQVVDLYTQVNAAGRIKYLKDNAAFIQGNVDLVINRWRASNGNYLATFLSTDKAGADVGSSLGEVVNAMVLHFERFVRDGKVGIPAGIRSAGIARPLATEALHGGYSAELAVESMQSLKRLFNGESLQGTDGIGLAENLQSLEAGSLATDINQAFDESITLLNGLVDPLGNQIESDNDKVITTFQKMQELVVLLKVDMTSQLGVTITFQDNDGD